MTSDTATAAAAQTQDNANLPRVSVPVAVSRPDYVTIIGLLFAFGLIIAAMMSQGDSIGKFLNIPSVLIVILGTITVTCVSYNASDLIKSAIIIGSSFFRPVRDFPALAKSMLDLATIGRKKGVLYISNYESQTRKEPFLYKALRLVVDGYRPEDIERILQQEIDMADERNKRAAGMLRRGSEIAPAMGLIGTLVGLVQMLANLDDPNAIGPAMAVALLTTFYGAILGTVVLAPLAAKLEKNADDETIAKTMSFKTAMSIIKQENPRNLEMMINSLLPASQRIRYFD